MRKIICRTRKIQLYSVYQTQCSSIKNLFVLSTKPSVEILFQGLNSSSYFTLMLNFPRCFIILQSLFANMSHSNILVVLLFPFLSTTAASLYSYLSHKILSLSYPDSEKSPLSSSESHPFLDHVLEGTGLSYGRFEVFTAVTMKNALFWDVVPCSFLCEPTFRRNLSRSSE
jgi:hypothetical protein